MGKFIPGRVIDGVKYAPILPSDEKRIKEIVEDIYANEDRTIETYINGKFDLEMTIISDWKRISDQVKYRYARSYDCWSSYREMESKLGKHTLIDNYILHSVTDILREKYK